MMRCKACCPSCGPRDGATVAAAKPRPKSRHWVDHPGTSRCLGRDCELGSCRVCALARTLFCRGRVESFSHRYAGYSNLMSDQIRKGDKVSWRSHGSVTTGTVMGKITSDTTTVGRRVRASKDEPQFRVCSDKSGREAVHKPQSLRRAM
jgi:DUF2945 family protein